MTNKQLKSETALIVVDMQNDYCDSAGALGAQGIDVSGAELIVPNLERIIEEFREINSPIIYIQTIHESATDSEAWLSRGKSRQTEHNGVCRRNTWGSDFYKLKPAKDDIIVNKHRYSAFYNTRLDSVLRSLKVEHICITGVATNVCVDSTVRDGFMRDYKVTVLEDCVAAFKKEAHDFTLQTIKDFFGEVKNVEQVIESLQERENSTIQV